MMHVLTRHLQTLMFLLLVLQTIKISFHHFHPLESVLVYTPRGPISLVTGLKTRLSPWTEQGRISNKVPIPKANIRPLNSMASPHVSGIAAMLMSKTKFESPNDLYTMIKNMGTPNILKPSDKAQGALLAYNGLDHL